MASCQSKSEDDAEKKVYKYHHKIGDQVGFNDTGTYVITQLEAIQKDWEHKVAYKGKQTELLDFKIVEGITEGDAAETYYILRANSADNSIKTAALLKLENGKFYFESPENSEDSYFLLICKSECVSGCDPMIKMYNGTKYLNCSTCTGCSKIDTEIH